MTFEDGTGFDYPVSSPRDGTFTEVLETRVIPGPIVAGILKSRMKTTSSVSEIALCVLHSADAKETARVVKPTPFRPAPCPELRILCGADVAAALNEPKWAPTGVAVAEALDSHLRLVDALARSIDESPRAAEFLLRMCASEVPQLRLHATRLLQKVRKE